MKTELFIKGHNERNAKARQYIESRISEIQGFEHGISSLRVLVDESLPDSHTKVKIEVISPSRLKCFAYSEQSNTHAALSSAIERVRRQILDAKSKMRQRHPRFQKFLSLHNRETHSADYFKPEINLGGPNDYPELIKQTKDDLPIAMTEDTESMQPIDSTNVIEFEKARRLAMENDPYYCLVPENSELVKILREMGYRLEVFKKTSLEFKKFYEAAQKIAKLTFDIKKIQPSHAQIMWQLGVNLQIASIILDFVKEQPIRKYDSLLKKTPEHFRVFLKIPGLGPMRIMALFRKLHINTLGELFLAAKNSQLSKVKGIGKKIENRILRRLRRHTSFSDNQQSQGHATDKRQTSIKLSTKNKTESRFLKPRRHAIVTGDRNAQTHYN